MGSSPVLKRIGFSPVTSAEETLMLLQAALDRIGDPEDGSTFQSGLVADREYTITMHASRGWKVQRYTGTRNLQTGHIIKLTRRAIVLFYPKPKLVLILYFTFLAYSSTDLTHFFCSAISVNYSTHPDPTLVGFGAVDLFFQFFRFLNVSPTNFSRLPSST